MLINWRGLYNKEGEKKIGKSLIWREIKIQRRNIFTSGRSGDGTIPAAESADWTENIFGRVFDNKMS
jgi:hypothetical protein